MRLGLLLSFMSIVAATGCIPRGPGVAAAQSAAPPEGSYAVELPLERTRWLVVEALVAGRPARLMVDTGAANSLLSPAFARSLGLAQVGTVPVADFENRRRTMPVVTAPLTLGTAEFRDVGFVVAELGEFAEAACRPIDGLLGQNVLHLTAYELDVHGGRMWLASDSGQLPAREGGQELRMAPPSYFAQLVAPARGLRPRFMMIDSGSPFALTVEDAVMAALPIGDTVRSSAAMSGLHGGAKIREETLFLWPDVPVAGLDLRGVDARGGRGTTTLGLQVLASYVIRVDPERYRISLWPNGVPLPRGHAILGVLFEVDGATWTVNRIIPRSPAERAGLAVGDRLIAVDDVALADMEAQARCELGRDFGARPRVRLQIERGGQRLDVALERAPIFTVSP